MILYGAAGLLHRRQAYLLLLQGMRLHWGVEQLPALARGKRGKPYFPDFPDYHFNLSHSGSLALCALSCRPVGADIQVVRPAWSPQLVDHSCTPAERTWLREQGDRPEDFALLWACKESAGKLTGEGLPYPPSRLTLPIPACGQALLSRQSCQWEGRWLRGYAGPGWSAAVCGWEEPPPEIHWLELPETQTTPHQDWKL